jgi:hypothetical protein
MSQFTSRMRNCFSAVLIYVLSIIDVLINSAVWRVERKKAYCA